MKRNALLVVFVMSLFAVSSVQAITPTPSTANPVSSGALPFPESNDPRVTTPAGNIKKSDYTLPYPGILQNHPLYFLKELRDKVIEALIVDPTRKSEFYLLQSDKWLAATVALVDKDVIDVAQKSLDQSTSRMIMASEQLKNAKTAGREIPSGTIDRMDGAIERHLEVIDELSVAKKIETSKARESLITVQDEMMKMRSQ